jgi:hypothetical protein
MPEGWAHQDQATHIQDWDRIGRIIADAIPPGPGAPESASSTVSVGYQQESLAGRYFHVQADQHTAFLNEVQETLKAEILRRRGRLAAPQDGAEEIALGADVVTWGSRRRAEPDRIRTEAVWHASFTSGGRTLMVVREPIYIFASDLPLYTDTSEAGRALTRVVRPLRYAE